MDSMASMRIDRAGVWFAIGAYGLWGIAPVYFKLLHFADPAEVVAHRVIWSVVVLGGVIWLRNLWPAVRALRPDQLGWLAVSGTLISVNWLLFVWAIFSERMLDASLGYFINPLMNVLLGVAFFREWLRPAQKAALLLAALGVANEVVAAGVVPWVGLTLALSFALYGAVRKRLAVGATIGLGLETTLMLPLAIGHVLVTSLDGAGTLVDGSAARLTLLAAAGPVTVVPLVCFAAAAVRLPLSVLGFFQYLAPSAMFLLAVFAYGEPFRPSQLVTFGCIWLALVIFSSEALYHQKRLSRQLSAKLPGGTAA
jgi:chloramphenicol-sensitive protein RarD